MIKIVQPSPPSSVTETSSPEEHTAFEVTPLTQYARDSNIHLLQAVLAASPEDLNRQDTSGMTALHWAAANRHAPMCERLLSMPWIDLTLKDHRGLTALDHATSSGDEIVIRLLMAKLYGDD